MNLALHIARRYLFGKRSTNAINIITSIAVLGIAIGTAALVLVLSVFNGFEDLITAMYSNFNPDIEITAAKGKTFEEDPSKVVKLFQLEGVYAVAKTLEETAFFVYKENQEFGTLKGVDKYYKSVTGIDSTIREGRFQLQEEDRSMAVSGLGMRNKLGLNVDDLFSSINVYMLKRKQSSGLMKSKPFRTKHLYPAGTFIVQTDYDNQYILTNLNFVRELMGASNELSALELSIAPGYDIPETRAQIRAIMGDEFIIKNRYEQQEAFMKLMQMEKWLSYAIIGLMVLMVALNMVGALWMIVLEKKKDIAILKSMGAVSTTIRNIFLSEGLLLCSLGLIVGFVLAIGTYFLQMYYGIIGVPGDFIVDAYPMSIRFVDFITVTITVLSIGLIASIPPALRAVRVSAMIREE
ncbi:MAG: ABC transporter permease [Saprospiraceae bacterium]|jgi:lipoprotein-releasing system permease protein|nr:ABC transporter permease [Saprospiraceae bacterium]